MKEVRWVKTGNDDRRGRDRGLDPGTPLDVSADKEQECFSA